MKRKALIFLIALGLILAFLAIVTPSHARVVAHVHVPSQTMRVMVDGETVHEWRVSTAGRGAYTPSGMFTPYWLSPKHRSKKYRGAPMPHAVFYSGDYAVHGTYDERLIGRPASRGCVRLTREHAKMFFQLVQAHGKANVIIVVSR